MPIVSVDYVYLGASPEDEAKLVEARRQQAERGDAEEEEAVPDGAITAMAIHDSESSAIYAFAVSRKGVCPDAVQRTVEALSVQADHLQE